MTNLSKGTSDGQIRWGILGTGFIAGLQTQDLADNGFTVQAVGSRTLEASRVFSEKFSIPTAHDSYEALVTDPAVDVVYVATPHTFHHAHALLALNAGKHVLVEKPFTINAREAQEIVALAEAKGLVVLEAMWSRFLPHMVRLREIIRDDTLGEIRKVTASHNQNLPKDPAHRLNDPALGGGALLDLGIYPVQLASMVLGAPRTITAVGAIGDTGVDLYSTLVLGYDTPAQSTLSTSLLARTPSVAGISGTEARIELGSPFHVPTTLVLGDNEFLGPTLNWADPTGVTLLEGLSWEATALATFVGEGRTESPLHGLAETVSILATIDEALRQLAV